MRIGMFFTLTVFIAQAISVGQTSLGDTTEIQNRDSSVHSIVSKESITHQSGADTVADKADAAREVESVSAALPGTKDTSTVPDSTATREVATDTLYQEEPASTANGNEATPSQGQEDFEPDPVVFDILLNLSLGISLTEFKLEQDVSTQMKPRFLLDAGVIVPFSRWFFAGVSLRYLQLSAGLSKSYSTFPNDYPVVSGTIKTEEKLTYVSAAVKCGMRFELDAISPYFYLGIEPAYLTAAGQYTVENIRTLWGVTGPEQIDKIITDNRVTRQRERHQIFAGGGIGLEIFYGYGSVFIDAGLNYALFDNDESNDAKSVFKRKSCRIFYFPVSLGIRFYL